MSGVVTIVDMLETVRLGKIFIIGGINGLAD